MKSFLDLSLSPAVARAVSELGFETPTAIQAQALPILLGDPTDFIGLAATGTGKTAAFTIPLLERLDPKVRKAQALILCPTRELANQVAGQVTLLGKHMGVRALPIYGGAGYGDQIHGLKSGVQVIVGTPGRVIDHLEKGTLSLDRLTTLILDEADEMISMGFKEAIEEILSKAPREKSQIWLFSATMSREVRKVADQYLRDPQTVEVNRTEMVPDAIEQLYYATSESSKPEVLCKLMDAADDFYGLIFCQTKQLVVDLTKYLHQKNYRVDCLHGDMEQAARERTMRSFREREVQILICTDVASRGIDVKDITHVINYSLPRELDNYVHRIGRTARSGKTGFAMSLVTPSHRGLISRIERMTKSKMKEGKLPTRKEIGIKKISKVLTLFQEQKDYSRAIDLLSPEWKAAIAEMPSEEIVGRFLCKLFPDLFSVREEAPARSAVRSQPVIRAQGVVASPSSARPISNHRPPQPLSRTHAAKGVVTKSKPKAIAVAAPAPSLAPVVAVAKVKPAVESKPVVESKTAVQPMIRMKPEWSGAKADAKSRWRDRAPRESAPKEKFLGYGKPPVKKASIFAADKPLRRRGLSS